MKKKIAGLVCLFLVFMVPFSWAKHVRNENVIKALKAINNKDYKVARKYVESLLSTDPEAQFIYGNFCENGAGGLKQDFKEACSWYRKAAEQNFPVAQMFLGDMYAAGKGVERDYDLAIKWYKKSILNGNKKAQDGLKNVKILQQFSNNSVDVNKKVKIANIRTKQDFVSADLNVYKGQNRLKNFDRIKYNKLVEEQRYIEVVRDIRSHKDVPVEVIEWIKEKSEEGHIPLQFELSNYYKESNPEEALTWLYIAYIGSIVDSYFNIDKTVRAAPQALLFVYQDLTTLEQKSIESKINSIDTAIKWHEQHPNRPSAVWLSYHGMSKISGETAGLISETEREIKRKEILDIFIKKNKKTI
jgi:TPR repeat protein